MADDRLQDLRRLPKLRDSLSYVYVEHCRIDKEDAAIALWDDLGKSPLPCSSVALLLAGPGTTVTHAAMTALADNNCLIAWCGEHGVRMYAFGTGGTRNSAALLRQAELVSDPDKRLEVAQRMYGMRYQEAPPPGLSLQQLRGWEGRRVRDAYSRASRISGVEWAGRRYDRGEWQNADPVNRALSAANSCLYGVCHAATLYLGLSPALGFIHTGKQLSFVYDLADLYKTAISIPIAFAAVKDGEDQLERRARLACRDRFRELNLLSRLADDIPRLLGLKLDEADQWAAVDADMALPGALWDPDRVSGVEGGMAYGSEEPELQNAN